MLDIAKFYLDTLLERYKYMNMPNKVSSPHIKFDEKVYKGYV